MLSPHEGSNCELLVQAIVGARGFELPPFRSSDLYEDRIYTVSVSDLSKVQTGDIIGLTKRDKKGFWGIHMGILVAGQNGEIRIIHNARHQGAARIQSLSVAMQYPEHEKPAWIKRPIIPNPGKFDPEGLRNIGLDFLIP